MPLPVDIYKTHPDAIIPEYATSGSCAFDLAPIENKVIQPKETVRLKTGLVICVPKDHVLLIASRSSTPWRYGINIPQGVGIVDQDYCGPEDELHLQLRNYSDKPVEIKKGQRIAQAMLVPMKRAEFREVKNIESKNRGGFGSTG